MNLLVVCLVVQGLLVGVAISASEAELHEVQTNSGSVRGESKQTLFAEKPYVAFKGIPYAAAPLNELRFKSPRKVEPWTETRDALTFGDVCLQKNFEKTEFIGDEDCLFLNIYTPDLSPGSKKAVMFFIHGGGYYEGSGNDDFYGPDFLINQDVILVTFNYRLGPFGFLSLRKSEYSGNMGIKDQQLALRWVNENIEQFGGDSSRITVFGHSAGSASAHLHVISPSSKGLFQRAIMMSGSMLNEWSSSMHDEHVLFAYGLSMRMGNQVYSHEDLLELLHETDADVIMQHLFQLPYEPGSGTKQANILWAPVSEELSRSTDPILPKTAKAILSDDYEHEIDTMFGFTTSESLFLVSSEMNDPSLLQKFNEQFQTSLPNHKAEINFAEESYKKLAAKIRTFYFGEGGQVNADTVVEFNELMSDIFFVYNIDESVKLQAAKSSGNTYYYRFSADAKLNAFKQLFNATHFPGASHADELCYIFRCNMLPNLYDGVEEGSVEVKLINEITALWTNFAKFGNPTPDDRPIHFKPIIGDEVNFVDITNEGLVASQSPNEKAINFWTDILAEAKGTLNRDVSGKDEL